MTQSPAVRLITELALANKGFVTLPTGGVDGNALIKSGASLVWGSGTGGTAVNSVNGRTGAVVLSANDVALGNVNNTSDAAKPVSTATQTALNGKADYPTGGTSGQVLTKSGTTTSWTTVSGSGTSGPSIVAPSPSGSDDTATLQALVTQAQATGGTLVLQAGTYKANLATAQSFNQPRIIGQGKNYTTIQGTVNTSPVLRFKGGSGQFSGGYVADLSISAAATGGGVGFEIADAGGVRWSRIEFNGSLAEGLRFHNEGTGGFTEFNQGDAEFASSVVTSVHYKRTSGNESFHGTGLTLGSVINHSSSTTTPEIVIDSGCFPYNAPLYVSMFTRVTVPLIQNNNTSGSRASQFYGAIDVENFVANAVLCDPATTNGVYFSGTVNVLGNLGFDYGGLECADNIYYDNNGITLQRKTVKVSVPSSATASGRVGMWAADSSFLYICTAANTWKRVAIAAW